MKSAPTAEELAGAAGQWFADAPPLLRWKMRLRCRTTPFERLVELVPPGASVLEVGGGAALFPALLAHCGLRVRVTGFDRDPERVAAAQRLAPRFAAGGSSLDFRLSDVAGQWPEGRFDVVAVLDLLHHLPPALHEQVVLEAARRLNPGGTLIFKDMCVRPRWRNWANRLHDLASFGQWIHDAPPERVQGWAEGAGLHLATAERLDRLWYGHELMVFRR
ncbi:MAG: class I SAM-dependent methyltransferase [Bryobacterales bacterium]